MIVNKYQVEANQYAQSLIKHCDTKITKAYKRYFFDYSFKYFVWRQRERSIGIICKLDPSNELDELTGECEIVALKDVFSDIRIKRKLDSLNHD